MGTHLMNPLGRAEREQSRFEWTQVKSGVLVKFNEFNARNTQCYRLVSCGFHGGKLLSCDYLDHFNDGA